MSDWIGSLIGGATGGVFDLVGGILQGNRQSKEARKAHKRDLWAYANRYQMMVRDLQAAGLNPLLAFGGMGAGGVPGAPMGQGGPNIMEGMSSSVGDMAEKVMDMRARAKQLKLLDIEMEKGGREVARLAIDAERLFREGRLFHQLEEKAHQDTILSKNSAESLRWDNLYKELGIPKAASESKMFEDYPELRKLNILIRTLTGSDSTGARQ